MMRLLPIVGYRIAWDDVLESLSTGCDGIAPLFPAAGNLFFLNSGAACCAVVLKALRGFSQRKKVVLPAYTAACLVSAVRQAGLRPVLCDMAPDGFNMDTRLLGDLMDNETLAVLGVHLFGLPLADIASLRERLPRDVFLVEDAAQAMGAKVGGRAVGFFGDAAFFSFNRGKNLPAYGGGCLVTQDARLADALKTVIGQIRKPSPAEGASIFFKVAALKLAFQPYAYRWLYPLIAGSKIKIAPKAGVKIEGCPSMVLKVLSRLAVGFEASCKARAANAKKLFEGLRDRQGLVLPVVSPDHEPAWNRFPVIFRDLLQKRLARQKLFQAGIEASLFYLKPLHHIFDLGCAKDAYPQATYLARHLLTLPVHPLVREKDVETMVRVIKEVVRS